MKLGKIIRQRRMEKGLSQSRLARESGISNNHMNLIELEKVDNIGMQTLEAIAGVLELNVSDLLLDEPASPVPKEEKNSTPTLLPLIGTAGLGPRRSGIHFGTNGLPHTNGCKRHLTLSDFNDPSAYAVSVGDESMHPISKGWRLAVSPQIKVRSGDPVVVYINAQEELLFREYHVSGSTRLLKPYHAMYDPIVLSPTGRIIMHRVFAIFPPELPE